MNRRLNKSNIFSESDSDSEIDDEQVKVILTEVDTEFKAKHALRMQINKQLESKESSFITVPPPMIKINSERLNIYKRKTL